MIIYRIVIQQYPFPKTLAGFLGNFMVKEKIVGKFDLKKKILPNVYFSPVAHKHYWILKKLFEKKF